VDVVLVHVGPDVQLGRVAEDDQRLVRRGADELARPQVHLQHRGVDRGPGHPPVQVGPHLLDLRFGLGDGRPGDGLVRRPRPGLEQVEVGLRPGQLRFGRGVALLAGDQLLLADRPRPDEPLGPGELVGLELQVGPGLADLRLGRRHLLGPRHLVQPLELRPGRGRP
jgi:hypothetical protein